MESSAQKHMLDFILQSLNPTSYMELLRIYITSDLLTKSEGLQLFISPMLYVPPLQVPCSQFLTDFLLRFLLNGQLNAPQLDSMLCPAGALSFLD